MRLLYTLFLLSAGGFSLFWLFEHNPTWKEKAEELLDFRTTNALEIRFSAQKIREDHRSLLKEKGGRFLESELKFVPHLLMEVKYCDKEGKTKESLILWDLADGEMVLNTETWEKTHGFADCILSRAQHSEFHILHALDKHKNPGMDLFSLQNALKVEIPILEALLSNCIKKNLVIHIDPYYRLHLENPRLTEIPQTKLQGTLTTRRHKRAQKAQPHFKSSQVEKVAKMAFGPTFTIRTKTPLYLPIHRIVVQDPEGAIETFHFNALNGKRLPEAPFYQ